MVNSKRNSKLLSLIISALLTLFSFLGINYTYAEEDVTTVEITERLPWTKFKSCKVPVNCTEFDCQYEEKTSEAECSVPWAKSIVYEVEIKRDFESVKDFLWGLLRYFTYIAFVFAILFITINWILISMSWIDSSAKEWAKNRITKTIMGLVLLSLSWVILNFIAPWIYK